MESFLRGKGFINFIVMRKIDIICIYNCGIFYLCIISGYDFYVNYLLFVNEFDGWNLD